MSWAEETHRKAEAMRALSTGDLEQRLSAIEEILTPETVETIETLKTFTPETLSSGLEFATRSSLQEATKLKESLDDEVALEPPPKGSVKPKTGLSEESPRS